MKLKRTFELLAVKAVSHLILAGITVLATLCITLAAMTTMVTVGTIFGLSLPYKLIAALVALSVLAVFIVLSAKHQKYLASTGHPTPDSGAGQGA
jgi:phosphate/sulfate permease